MAEISKPELIRRMVGRELSTVFPKRPVELGETILQLQQLGCSRSGLRNITLSIRAGEILGLAGLVGAGRTELARTIFGLTPADQGTILLRGASVIVDSPSKAVSLGIGYLPEDRRKHGLIMEMAISSNTTLAALARLSRIGFLDFGQEREISVQYANRLAVKTPSLAAEVSTLSGGNQQKVAISRWLATDPSLLILDEPTQGVDVGAKSEIHRLMVDLAEEGLAIMMISSELPEIFGMSDRIAVMHEGTLVGTVDVDQTTQSEVLAMALGEHRQD
jgi:rhamnose transport system ATP-binding protein